MARHTVGDEAAGYMARFLDATFAQSLKTFYLTVGNSWVTAGFLIATALILQALIAEAGSYALNNGSLAELERYRAAQARYWDLKAADLAATVDLPAMPAWTLASFSTTAEGVEIRFPVNPGSIRVNVSWQSTRGSGAGVDTVDLPAGLSIGEVIITAAEFGAAWVPGQTILISLEQVAADGRSARFSGGGSAIKVP